MKRLLGVAVVAASAVLMVSGCTRLHEGKPVSGFADPFQVAGKPVTTGPTGLRPGAPGPTRPVEGTDDGDADKVAAMSIADIEQFWDSAYGPTFNGTFTPVSAIYSWESNRPGATVCGRDAFGFVNAMYCPDIDTIVWDRGVLVPQLRRQAGDLFVAEVLAHEYGHAIQDEKRANLIPPNIPMPEALLVGEQQADCFAGAYLSWVADGKSPRFTLNTGDGLNTQMAAMLTHRDPPPRVEPPNYQHGSAFERITAFQFGFTDGAPKCAQINDQEIAQRRGNLPVALQQLETGEARIDKDTVTSVVKTLTTLFKPAKAPKLSFDPPSCSDAQPSPPASYCPSTDTITVYLPGLENIGAKSSPYSLSGDYTAYSVLASRFMLAIQQQHGLVLNNTEAALRTACLTGVATAKLAENTPGSPIQLSAGDLDEAVTGILTNGLAASDVNGTTVPVGFSRIEAFRTGVLGNDTDRCIKLFR